MKPSFQLSAEVLTEDDDKGYKEQHRFAKEDYKGPISGFGEEIKGNAWADNRQKNKVN